MHQVGTKWTGKIAILHRSTLCSLKNVDSTVDNDLNT